MGYGRGSRICCAGVSATWPSVWYDAGLQPGARWLPQDGCLMARLNTGGRSVTVEVGTQLAGAVRVGGDRVNG